MLLEINSVGVVDNVTVLSFEPDNGLVVPAVGVSLISAALIFL
jgi:hypothetical protein